MYPENQGRTKRQEINKSRWAVSDERHHGREVESLTHYIQQAIQRNTNVTTRTACDEAEPCARNGQAKYGGELALDDLHDITFDDSCIDESLFAPWIMDAPMQHTSDGGSSSSSSGNPTCKFLVL